MQINHDLADLAKDQKTVRARPAMPKTAPVVEVKTMTSRKAEADAAAEQARAALAPAVQAPSATIAPVVQAAPTIEAQVKAARAPKVKPVSRKEAEAASIAFERERLRLWRAGVAPALTRQGGVRDVSGQVHEIGGRFMTDLPVCGPLRQSKATAEPLPYEKRMIAYFRENA